MLFLSRGKLWTRHTDSGMGSVWKCCVVAVVFCGISSFGLDYQSQPGPGFQFHCGQDLCTFPHQYCDTDDYRCLYCSDDLCLSKDLPDQCTSYCKGNHIVIWIIIIVLWIFFLIFNCLVSSSSVLTFLNQCIEYRPPSAPYPKYKKVVLL